MKHEKADENPQESRQNCFSYKLKRANQRKELTADEGVVGGPRGIKTSPPGFLKGEGPTGE